MLNPFIKRQTKRIIILFAILVLLIFYLMPTPQGLSPEGKISIGVFLFAIILWVSAALPLSVTGLIIIAIIPLLGIIPAKESLALFGNKAVFFIMGALMLAIAMKVTGLSRLFAGKLLKKFIIGPRWLALGILLSSAMLSFIMPEHAVAALMFPIILGIVDSLNLEQENRAYAAMLFISMAWGCIIGGIATYLGGARNVLAIGILQESYNIQIGFFNWIIAALPLVAGMLLAAAIIIFTFFKFSRKSVGQKYSKFKMEETKLDWPQKKVLFVLILTLIGWIFFGNKIGLEIIALLSVGLLFFLRCMKWSDVEKNLNFGIILMYGGAITLGAVLNITGAAQWIANWLLSYIDITPLLFIIIFSALSIFLTELISNVAVVVFLLPIAFSIGQLIGINPIAITLIIALPAGLAFILPMATPPNAIAYSSGMYEIKKLIIPGLLLNITGIILTIIIYYFYWPLIGVT